ncbi:mRNA (N6-adenosine)-methyltransferase [Sugiyamaella lignohabitans]|uniref:mRNA (N6-adenosine)-methyltransferase n=1 Tax=Sugiyamaella lignohabitans TaxID=796027 RepID=A0A167E8C0_9ASCO|nr:mRNA (N6-adenosine)-methyltransferase [Sugiyamaella lignohabitans]ANB13765.1 mRNA (N6-adenosine)-methyltransferase [Sugiyamaella lignohabitans]
MSSSSSSTIFSLNQALLYSPNTTINLSSYQNSIETPSSDIGSRIASHHLRSVSVTGSLDGEMSVNDNSLEEIVVSFLINHKPKLFPALPFGINVLLRTINQVHNCHISSDAFDNACLNLAMQIPSSFVVSKMCSQNASYSSKYQLEFYDPEMLILWSSSSLSTIFTRSSASSSGSSTLDCSISVIADHDTPNRNLNENIAYADNSKLYQTMLSLITNDDSYYAQMRQTLANLLSEPTQRNILYKEQILSASSTKPYVEICPYPKRNECLLQGRLDCLRKIHFEPVITSNTDVSIGDCSYLDTCFKGKGCKYVHYRITYPDTFQRGQARQPQEAKQNQGPLFHIAERDYSKPKVGQNISEKYLVLITRQIHKCLLTGLFRLLPSGFAAISGDLTSAFSVTLVSSLPTVSAIEPQTTDLDNQFNLTDFQLLGIYI